MADWRTYGGIITISAGIAVVGSLWLDGNGRAFSGEDWAEVAAGIAERVSVVQDDWDGEFSTNGWYIIGRGLSRSQLEVLQDDVLGEALDGYGDVFWCDAATVPAGSSWEIATAEGGLSVVTNSGDAQWNFVTVSNAATDFVCAADRVWTNAFDYDTNTYADAVQGVDQFYSYAVDYQLDPAPVGGAWNWWNYIGNGTNTYVWSWPPWFVGTRELDEFARVLTNMNACVAFVAPGGVEFDQVKQYWYGYPSYPDGVSTGYVGGSYSALDIDDAVGAINNIVGDFYTNMLPGSFNGELSYVQAGGYYQGVWNQEWNGTTWDTVTNWCRFDVNCRARHTQLYQAYFDWPATNAFQMGYVKKFSVYACLTVSVGTRNTRYDFDEITTFSGVQPNHYETRTFGVASAVCELPADLTVPATTNQVIYPASLFDSYESIKLELIYSESNPTARPVFNVGSTSASVSFSLSDFDRSAGKDELYDPGYDWWQQWWDDIDFENTVTVRGWVLVAEWDFEHMDMDERFVPTTYEPVFEN